MRNFLIGDPVTKFFEQTFKGVVIGTRYVESNLWTTNGSAQAIEIAAVRLASGKIVEVPSSELMRDQ